MAGYQGTSTRTIEVEQIEALIDARLRDLRGAMKGTVGAYLANSQQATVAPKLSMTVAGKTITAPDIPGIPVLFPRRGGYGLHFPLKSGNALTLIALDRPADQWQESGGSLDAAQGRIGDLSNIVAMPGGYPETDPMAGAAGDGMYVGSDDGKRGMRSADDGNVSLKGGPSGSDKIRINAAGKVDIVAESGDSLLQIIRDFLVAFRDHTNSGAPLDAPFVAAANSLIAKIDGMKA